MTRTLNTIGAPGAELPKKCRVDQRDEPQFAGRGPVCKDAQGQGTDGPQWQTNRTRSTRRRCSARRRSFANCRTISWTRSGRARRFTICSAATFSSARRAVELGLYRGLRPLRGLGRGQESAINEIGVGEPIGEIGFFAGIARTATIVAARDSVVIELDRASFDDVARQVPSIYPTLLRTLARRLADATRASRANGAAWRRAPSRSSRAAASRSRRSSTIASTT